MAFASCNNDEIRDNNDKEKDIQGLEKMYQEIVTLSQVNSQTCTDSNEWNFIAIGTKACGGPEKFIIYSKKINTADFQAKVKAYNEATVAFNLKWNIFSTCDVVQAPDGIGCVDGKPVLLKATAL